MADTPTLHQCHSCQADWSQGQWTPDCPECGGGALDCPCLFCGGKCQSRWERAVLDSHDSGQAHWVGKCGLSDKEKKAIRDERVKEYEKERELKFKGGMRVSGKASRGTMILLVLLGSALVRNGDNLLRFLGRHADEVVVPLVRHEGDEVIQAGARAGQLKNKQMRPDWIYRDMSELAKELADQKSGQVKADSLRLNFIDSLDVEKLMFGERKK